MNKNSMTLRSVTFAAIAGLSMSIAAPVAIAQDNPVSVNETAGNSPLVNKNAKGCLLYTSDAADE